MKKILKLGIAVVMVLGVFTSMNSATAAKKPVTKPVVYKINKELTIAGTAAIPKEHAVKFIQTSAPEAKLNCSVEKIVEHYYKEAEKEGIRGDVALAQALVETGFFKYGGSVNYRQNNFCGLGTTSSAVRGASFRTPEIGVRAHIQHLLVYSSRKLPKERIVDPRFDTVKKLPHLYATSQKWMDLSGRWAADKEYGTKVLTVYARMTTHAVKNGYKEPKESKSKKIEKDNRPLQERIDDILRGK